MFVGKASPWGDENSPDASTDSVYDTNFAWRNSLAAKRIDIKNVFHVIPRYDWTSGTVYSDYDDSTDLFTTTTKFYVLTEDDNVYKCIFNNNGGVSTSKPTSTGSEIITTDDGYRWKFMFRVSEDSKPFLTKEFIPVKFVTFEPRPDDENDFQWNVQSSATDGGIEDIRVGTTGDSVYASSTLSSAFIGEAVGSNQGANNKDNNVVILNNGASDTDDYYNNYVLYIDGGLGSVISPNVKIPSGGLLGISSVGPSANGFW